MFNKTIENATLQQDDPLGLMEMETAAPSGGASNAMEEEHVCHNSLTPFLHQRMCIKTPTSDIACSPQDSAGADGTRQQQQAGGAEPPQQELECLSRFSRYPNLD